MIFYVHYDIIQAVKKLLEEAIASLSTCVKEDFIMSKNNNMVHSNGTSKLALLRQKRSIQKQEIDIEKAIDGFATTLDDKKMLEEIAKNSASVDLIIDRSGSMDGTASPIVTEINQFALRQAAKMYTTKLSLTLFNRSVSQEFSRVDVREYAPISSWYCEGGTNINDAVVTAMKDSYEKGINHKLHLLITDGQNEYSLNDEDYVKELITKKQMAGEHVFLLYNKRYESQGDAKIYAMHLGIDKNFAVNFDRNGDGIKIIFQTIEDVLDGLRMNGEISKDWARAITAHAADPLQVKAREVKYLC